MVLIPVDSHVVLTGVGTLRNKQVQTWQAPKPTVTRPWFFVAVVVLFDV